MSSLGSSEPGTQRTPPTGTQSVHLEVWSDVQCSWCPIGARRLEAAVAAFDGTVMIRHRTFALAPDAPLDFDPGRYTRTQRGITEAQRQDALAAVTAAAAAEQLNYHLGTAKPTNSRSSHRMLHHAADLGMRDALSERLTHAYFVEGRHLGRIEELVELAADAGLDPAHARQALVDDEYADAVDADHAAANALGVSGVPFVVIDERWGISGAQPWEVYLQALQHAAQAGRQEPAR